MAKKPTKKKPAAKKKSSKATSPKIQQARLAIHSAKSTTLAQLAKVLNRYGSLKVDDVFPKLTTGWGPMKVSAKAKGLIGGLVTTSVEAVQTLYKTNREKMPQSLKMMLPTALNELTGAKKSKRRATRAG